MTNVAVGELLPAKKHSLDPRKMPRETFELLSIPAFDAGHPDIVVGAEVGSSKQIVEPGDVMISKIVPHIRRAWVVPKPQAGRQIASSEWIVFRSQRFHPPYLRQVLLSDRFHLAFMQTVAGVGGSLLRARPSYVAEIEVPLPPIEEQRRIAAVLDAADELRTKRRQALAKLDTLTQAIFIDEVVGVKDIEPLGLHVEFLTTGARGWAKYYSPSGKRFVRSLDVQMNAIGEHDIAFVEPPNTTEAKRIRITEGDVLLTVTGSRIGRCATAPASLEGAFASQHVAILRTSGSLVPAYLARWLAHSNGGQRQIAARQYGQTKPGLNFEQIRSFQLPVLPVDEQIGLVNRCNSASKLRTKLEESAGQLDTLFASLQQRAFAGEL